LSGIIIGFVSLKAKQREDTVINAIWAIGMSLGILFMAKTPGYVDPQSYLFGNILLITTQDLILMLILDIIVVILAWRFYPQVEACAFDEEFAQVRGIPVQKFFLVTLIITACAVVLLQTFVGIIMVIAMLTLPAGTASTFSKSLSGMMIASCLLSFAFFTSGIVLSWNLDVPVGALTVIISGSVFLISSHLSRKFRS
jgi:zinc transport system permease protein